MPAKAKAAHHRGSYQLRARAVVNAARANPDTICWRCHRTLTQHEPHRNGTPATWTAGHLIDGQVNGELRAEASTCNKSAGATHGNQRRNPTSRRW